MIGKLLGKALSLPVRLANLPVKIAERAIDEVTGDEAGGTKETLGTSEPLDRLAEILEEAAEETFPEDE